MIAPPAYDIQGCGCCEPLPEFPPVIANRPALSALRYRIGDYLAFRQNLLASIRGKDLLRAWSSRDNLDYGIAILDLWAYLADILTFYQERIANEAFLRTATLRESVLRLAALLDYRLGPGAAAIAYLAFTLDKGKALSIPVGLRVQSVPGQHEKPQKFETIEEIAADARYNLLAAYPVPEAFNPFEPGNTQAAIAPGVTATWSKPLAPGERLLLFAGQLLERKELIRVRKQERETVLEWIPGVQHSGLDVRKARLVAYGREFAVFGANGPSQYMEPVADATAPGGFRWQLKTLDPALSLLNTPEVPLAQKVENLKPGTPIVLAVSPAAPGDTPRTRLTTVAAAEVRSASHGLLVDSVTHLRLATSALSAPIAVNGVGSRVCVFVIGDDTAVWYRRQSSSTQYDDWRTLGGDFAQLAVERDGAGRIQLFALDGGGAVWMLSQTTQGSWGEWQPLGGQGDRLSVTRRPAGRLGLFLRTPDGAVWFSEQTASATWTAWQSLGGSAQNIAAITNQNGAFQVFAIGTDHTVVYNRRVTADGAWQGWQSLDRWADLLRVARNDDGRLEVFIRGVEKSLWRTKQTVANGNAWGGWINLGGFVDQLAVTMGSANRLTVFARGNDRKLLLRVQTVANAESYTAWSQGLGDEIDGLEAMTDPTNLAKVHVRLPAGSVAWAAFTGTSLTSTAGLGFPIWSTVDRRRVTIYELTRPSLPLRTEHFPETISGQQLTVPVTALREVPAGRRIILDDDQQQPHLASVLSASVAGDSLTLTFTPALPRPLNTRTAILYGNVARSTHGETISNEVLGNGDAAQRFLAFPLKKSPLTFVPQQGAPNGVASSLKVRVDDILWKQVSSLLGAGPNDRVYTTMIEDQAKTTVQFGGEPGARVPTGRNNLIASYRQGLGIEGNVRARTLATLLDRPAGLKAVINPGAAEGGAMPETLEQARINAPSTVKTFGRIVSLRDFEDAARELAVVAKARAYVDWDGEEQAVFVVVAGAGGSVLSASLGDIAADLDRRRDINRAMRVKPHRPLPLELILDVLAHPDYTIEAVTSRVKGALTAFFAFDNRELGQPVFESDVYHVVQSQEGVLAVDLDRLRAKGAVGMPETADIAVPLEAIASLDLVDVHLSVRHGEL